MGWVKIDDQFLTHPKVLAAGKDGRALIVAGLCYCAAGLTDGLIVDGALPMVAGAADVKGKPTAARLVELGIWHRSGHACEACLPCPAGHFLVHDYHVYQSGAEDEQRRRKEISAKRAEAGKRGAAARWGKANVSPDAMATDWQTGDMPCQTDGSGMAPSPSLSSNTGLSVSSSDSPPTDDDELVEAVTRCLGALDCQRQIDDGRPISNPKAYARVCANERRGDPAIVDAVRAHPDWDPERIARAIHDAEHPPAPVPAPAGPVCATCEGRSVVLPDDSDETVPCPACTPTLRAVAS